MNDTTTTAATARPWVLQSQGPDEPVFILGPEPANAFLARMGPPWSEYKSIQEALGKREDEIANARLIVLAVNNHDALVAALQGVQTLVERHVRAFGQEASALAFINDPDTPKAFTAMRQALADAEGGS